MIHLWGNVISGKKIRGKIFLTLEFKNIKCDFACKSIWLGIIEIRGVDFIK